MPKSTKRKASAKSLGGKRRLSSVTSTKKKAGKKNEDVAIWNLRLYVAGQSPKSMTAFANLKRICEQHLAGRYRIEVLDLIKNPKLAQGDQILAIPTLVRKTARTTQTDYRRPLGHRAHPGGVGPVSSGGLIR